MSHRDWIDREYPHHPRRGHMGQPPGESFARRMRDASLKLMNHFKLTRTLEGFDGVQ